MGRSWVVTHPPSLLYVDSSSTTMTVKSLMQIVYSQKMALRLRLMPLNTVQRYMYLFRLCKPKLIQMNYHSLISLASNSKEVIIAFVWANTSLVLLFLYWCPTCFNSSIPRRECWSVLFHTLWASLLDRSHGCLWLIQTTFIIGVYSFRRVNALQPVQGDSSPSIVICREK